MKNNILVSFICSIFSGTVMFISTNNIYFSVFIIAVYFISILFLMVKFVAPSSRKKKTFHECYQFINSFFISLSITQSIASSYDKAILGQNGYLKDQSESITHLLPKEKIIYLKNYFSFDIYHMFVQIIEIYEEQGGDILAMSHSLTNELTRIENSINLIEKRNKRKLFDFILLWLTTFAILVFCRVALNEFMNSIFASNVYLASLFAFFVFVLISIFVFIKQFSTTIFIGDFYE